MNQIWRNIKYGKITNQGNNCWIGMKIGHVFLFSMEMFHGNDNQTLFQKFKNPLIPKLDIKNRHTEGQQSAESQSHNTFLASGWDIEHTGFFKKKYLKFQQICNAS